jgi:alpha,alpha-trehalose phosphorylase
MIHRELKIRPEYAYPADEWRMVETRYYPRLLAQNETLFAVANGYLGIRGAPEEGGPAYKNGTFVNGFYESWPIVYGEEAFGFATTGQTIVNVTDSKIIKLYVDDEPFWLPNAILGSYERALDMRNGTLDRNVVWETPSGKQVSIRSRRLVSFAHRHLAAISYEVTVLNAAAPVVISSEMLNRDDDSKSSSDDPRQTRGFQDRVLHPLQDYADDQRVVLCHTTWSSRMSIACGIDHRLETDCPHTSRTRNGEDSGQVVYSIDAKPGVPIRLIKFMTYTTTRTAAPAELCERVERTLDRAVSHGFEDLLASQREFLDDFWHKADVKVRGHTGLQQALRFNLYQLCQASARAERVGIPAKGLTGSGYEGHHFWDTEIYVLPFLMYTEPRIARNLLKVRHAYLDRARERARQVNQKGAMFPWRTISGEEASAYYAAGTAQYHINADIMYALKKYVDVTGDREFLDRFGAEMLVETARLWTDLGFYSKQRGGKFCIHGVTGPDEYNTVVNNNAFTNLMARENLRYATETVRTLRRTRPDRYAGLVDRTGFDPAELRQWKKAADNMYIPYDRKLGIHPQDDQFLEREPWDFENTPADRYPLLLHHHPLVIYRHQVIKQADIVLAMFLLGHEFARDQKKRNFEFYDPLTTGDSSLSVCIQAIIAAELGERDLALKYFRYALLMDLADIGQNVKDGCHIASMGGTWMMPVYGLAGMRDRDGRISFRPFRPERIEGLSFRLRIRGRLLEVDIGQEGVRYGLIEGEELEFEHDGKTVRLTRQRPETVEKFPADKKSSARRTRPGRSPSRSKRIPS